MSTAKKRPREPPLSSETSEAAAEAEFKALSPDVGRAVLPGDPIRLPANVTVRIGAGLAQEGGAIVAVKCGLLSQPEKTKLYVDTAQKRYLPAVEDLVVGTIIEKHAESYKVDIGTTHPARLPALAFEGATKRNRPNIPLGALIYARVAAANKHMETELTCTSPHLKKEWVTGESIFGELTGGYMFKCSLRLARRLLEEDNVVLSSLGKAIPFELAVGVNGHVWVNSATPARTVAVVNAILNSERLTETQTVKMVDKIVERIAAQDVDQD